MEIIHHPPDDTDNFEIYKSWNVRIGKIQPKYSPFFFFAGFDSWKDGSWQKELKIYDNKRKNYFSSL